MVSLAGEAIGAGLDLLVPERFKAAHDNGLARAVATGSLRVSGRVLRTRSKHKDGRKLYVDFSFSLWQDDAGQVLGVCASAHDATAQQLRQQAAAGALTGARLTARRAAPSPASRAPPCPAAP